MSSPIALLDEPFLHSLQVTSLPAEKDIQIESEAYIEVQKLLASDDAQAANTPASGYGVFIQERGGNAWSNDYIQSDLLFSPAANPRRLLTPIYLVPDTVLNVSVKTNGLTLVYNRFDLALSGIKRRNLTPERYSLARQRPYFAYVSEFGKTFAAGESSWDLYITIKNDGAFVVQNLCMCGVFNGTTYNELGGLRVQIVNVTENNRNYYSNPVGVFQAFGQPDVWQGPNRLLNPLIFRPLSIIKLQFTLDTTEIAALTTDWKNMQFAFEGYKVLD